jgi:uncharacterized repeat protein (TIGR01451 family)
MNYQARWRRASLRRWSSGRILRGAVSAAFLAGIATLTVSIGPASADETISSSGPLTSIGVTSELNCSANYSGDTSGEWYGNTACGTLLATGGTLYGPSDIPAGEAASPLTAWTPVSQTAVTGSGTASSPYQVVTVDTGGTIKVTETDTYVVGQESYQDAVEVTNTGSETAAGVLYRAGDCYLQDSDTGYGIYDSSTGAISCTTSLTPGSRIEQMDPQTAGSDYYEGYYNSMWAAVGTQDPFPDTCDCSIDEDNALGLSWSFSLAGDASQTYSSFVTFSPSGVQPITLAKTADSSTVAAGGTDGYTITATNPNTTAVTLATLTDTLGAGFTYQPGTTTGVTTTNPTVSGQTLTWDNIVVPASGSASLHFDVTAPSTAGTYDDDAEGTASGYTVAGTGATAPVTVTSAPKPTTLSTSLSGGGQSGASITVPAGTAVTDSATLSGTNAAKAGGTITYKVYTNAGCTTLASGGGGTAENITTAGTLPASAAVTLSTPGTYYWQASYSGDANNAASVSTCGAETETVNPPNTTTTTCQTGQSCTAAVTIAGSMGVSVTGTSSTTGSLTVSLGTNTISCGDPFRHAPSMSTVSESGLTINGTKTAVVTIDKSVVFARGAPLLIPYAVCYSSTHPFKSITGKLTTLGLLPYCSSLIGSPPFGPPPCVVSLLPDRSGNVIETLRLPGYDPRFH